MLSNASKTIPVTKHHLGIDRRSLKVANNATAPPAMAATKARMAAFLIGWKTRHNPRPELYATICTLIGSFLQWKSVGFPTVGHN
jgi:hypothetical protein